MTIRVAVVLLSLSFAFPAGKAKGQEVGGLLDVVENLFGGEDRPAPPVAAPIRVRNLNRPAAVIKKNVGADFVNMYTPFLAKALTTELHFVKKVCEPTDEQFDEIHRAGLLAVASTSKHYEDLQRIRQSANQWPEPHKQITSALAESIRKTLPIEKAELYEEEIEARERAHFDAAVGMILVHIDDVLLLTPEQHEKLFAIVRDKWSNSWSKGARLFMYPQYAQLPGTTVIGTELSARQKVIWTRRGRNNTSVNFGWQMELGLQDWFGVGIELKAFEKPAKPKVEDDASWAMASTNFEV